MTGGLEHSQWSGKTDGLPWMQKSLVVMLRFLPMWLLYGIMALVLPFYMIFGKGFRATFVYYRNAFHSGCFKSCLYVYKNYFQFGQVVLDRFAYYAGKKFRITVDGMELFREMERRPEGFVTFSAHVGNYEMAGYALATELKTMNALVYAQESEVVMNNRKSQFDSHRIRMVPVAPDMSHLFALNAALDEGNIVSVPVDRIYGSQKCAEIPFFGRMAKFPLGGFALAAQKGVDALSIFVMKESYCAYHVYVQPVGYDKAAPRQERAMQLGRNYVAQLERILKIYPTQWYNYFDLWV